MADEQMGISIASPSMADKSIKRLRSPGIVFASRSHSCPTPSREPRPGSTLISMALVAPYEKSPMLEYSSLSTRTAITDSALGPGLSSALTISRWCETHNSHPVALDEARDTSQQAAGGSRSLPPIFGDNFEATDDLTWPRPFLSSFSSRVTSKKLDGHFFESRDLGVSDVDIDPERAPSQSTQFTTPQTNQLTGFSQYKALPQHNDLQGPKQKATITLHGRPAGSSGKLPEDLHDSHFISSDNPALSTSSNMFPQKVKQNQYEGSQDASIGGYRSLFLSAPQSAAPFLIPSTATIGESASEPKYDFRPLVGTQKILIDAFLDDDASGNFGQRRPNRRGRNKRPQDDSDADQRLEGPDQKKSRKLLVLYGRWNEESAPISISLSASTLESLAGKALINQIKADPSPNNWPEHVDRLMKPENNFTELDSASIQPARLRDRKAIGKSDRLQEIGDAAHLRGHPLARGCIACFETNMPCSLLQDQARWPCELCTEEGEECELITEPKEKRPCQRCRKRRIICSFRNHSSARGPCLQCSSKGFSCVAGPKDGRARHGPSLVEGIRKNAMNGRTLCRPSFISAPGQDFTFDTGHSVPSFSTDIQRRSQVTGIIPPSTFPSLSTDIQQRSRPSTITHPTSIPLQWKPSLSPRSTDSSVQFQESFTVDESDEEFTLDTDHNLPNFTTNIQERPRRSTITQPSSSALQRNRSLSTSSTDSSVQFHGSFIAYKSDYLAKGSSLTHSSKRRQKQQRSSASDHSFQSAQDLSLRKGPSSSEVHTASSSSAIRPRLSHALPSPPETPLPGLAALRQRSLESDQSSQSSQDLAFHEAPSASDLQTARGISSLRPRLPHALPLRQETSSFTSDNLRFRQAGSHTTTRPFYDLDISSRISPDSQSISDTDNYKRSTPVHKVVSISSNSKSNSPSSYQSNHHSNATTMKRFVLTEAPTFPPASPPLNIGKKCKHPALIFELLTFCTVINRDVGFRPATKNPDIQLCVACTSHRARVLGCAKHNFRPIRPSEQLPGGEILWCNSTLPHLLTSFLPFPSLFPPLKTSQTLQAPILIPHTQSAPARQSKSATSAG